MTTVDKILVGSPTYKTVVGNVTQVRKVVVGVPLSTVTIGPYVDIDNIVGLDTTGKTEGGVILYDSASATFIVSDAPKLEVDGKFYPATVYGDSDHTNILIRRSGTQGEPLILQQGELAYSFLADPSTDGFGNGGDRLYIATGANDINGNSTKIDVIGGKYFTQLLNHQQGELTANSAIITDANKRVDRLLADSAGFTIVRATDAYVENLNLTASRISADSAQITDRAGNNYLTWSTQDSSVVVYSGSKEAFRSYTKTIDDIEYSGLLVPNLLEVNGLSFFDSTTINGDLLVTGDLYVQGDKTSIETTELLVEDKRIVIGRNTPTAVAANNSGIAVGDSNTPIATITYINDGVNPAVWEFSPGIRAPIVETVDFSFEVIDCGTYA